MIHYHGTPITPNAQLLRMAGRHFCVSYATPYQANTCLQIGQSVMFDNGAFTTYTKGKKFDYEGYYEWLEPKLVHPHWAVVPDVIDGSLEDQYKMLSTWPRESFGYDHCAPVFHLHMPITHLYFLCNAYQKVCLGSSGQYWKIGTPQWTARMDEIFNELAKRYRKMPWIHGLRMLGQVNGGWPLASADSTNVAQNHWITGCAECKASRVDREQPSQIWKNRNERQETLWD